MNTSSGQYDANCTMHKIAAESGGKQFEGAFRQSSQRHKATTIFRYTAVAARLISCAGWHAMLPITHPADIWVPSTSCTVALVYSCWLLATCTLD